jgi:dTDP-4-amino-4,6-dideoxygalactose transaminase
MPDRLALFGGTPVLDSPHRCSWPPIDDRHRKEVGRLLDRGEISYYGREGAVGELEDLWSARLDGRRTLAMSSGTAALHSAFFALGAGPGDEVLCPTNTFLATVMPLVPLGASPVLCDAEPDTGNVDPTALEREITDRTTGIVVTHLWGHPCDMEAIGSLARRHRLWVVEDCSHAHGSTFAGQEVGTFGAAAAFSFQGAKMVYAGQGGMLASGDDETHERACLLGHFRVRSEQDVTSDLKRFASTGFGLNYRMHPLAAALALVSSHDLDGRIRDRTSLLDRLAAGLRGVPGVEPPTTRPGCTRGAYYGFKVRFTGEWTAVPVDLVVDALVAEGLDVNKPGSRPLHLLPFFAEPAVPLRRGSPATVRTPYPPGEFEVAERLWAESVSFPTFTDLADAPIVDRYVEAVGKVHRQLGALASSAPRSAVS